MGWTVKVDGEFVMMPFDGDWMVPTLDGRFPDEVMLRMDEDRFKRGIEPCAATTICGDGEYATLAYCGSGLTIHRHLTLEDAIRAKRAIDGGGCCKVHIIIQIDRDNPRKAKQNENIRKWRAEHSSAAGFRHDEGKWK